MLTLIIGVGIGIGVGVGVRIKTGRHSQVGRCPAFSIPIPIPTPTPTKAVEGRDLIQSPPAPPWLRRGVYAVPVIQRGRRSEKVTNMFV